MIPQVKSCLLENVHIPEKRAFETGDFKTGSVPLRVRVRFKNDFRFDPSVPLLFFSGPVNDEVKRDARRSPRSELSTKEESGLALQNTLRRIRGRCQCTAEEEESKGAYPSTRSTRKHFSNKSGTSGSALQEKSRYEPALQSGACEKVSEKLLSDHDGVSYPDGRFCLPSSPRRTELLQRLLQ